MFDRDDGRMKTLAVVLLTLATTISMQQARKIALARVPNGSIQSAELEKENGKLIYSFDIKKAGAITEVNVDAKNGRSRFIDLPGHWRQVVT